MRCLSAICMSVGFALLSIGPLPAIAQEPQKPAQVATIAKGEESNPSALRRRKAQLESELVQLRGQLTDLRRQLEEVRLVELEVSGPAEIRSPSIGIVEVVDRDVRSVNSELEPRARAVLRDIRGERRFSIDADRFSTFTAKKLALDLSKQRSAESSLTVPAACRNPQLPSSANRAAIDRVVEGCIAAIRAEVSGAAVTTPSTAQAEVAKVKGTLESEIKSTSERIAANELAVVELDSMLGASNDLTETIVRWTIPSLGVLLVLILLGPRLYSQSIQEGIFSNKLILELLTVYILVSTILILGLANRIQNEVLGTLLGGISGYVLGRSLSNGSQDRRRDDQSKADTVPKGDA